MTMQDRPQSGWERHGVAPGKAFQVFGMRRSGNHAIVDWLMRNAPGDGGLFFNNCKMGADPINNFSSLDTYPDPEEVPEQRGRRERWQPPDLAPSLIVVSYEDNLPPAPGKADWASRGFKAGDFDTKIMIYRSFLNWSASMLRKIQNNDGFGALSRMRIMGRAMDMYAEGLDRIGIEGLTAICYDDWMLSESYRAGTLSALGLPCKDNTHGKVQRFGGGSSFERQDAAPEEMDTTARAAQMAQDLEYRAMLWTAAQDDALMARLETHFPDDARRLAALSASADLNITLEAAT